LNVFYIINTFFKFVIIVFVKIIILLHLPADVFCIRVRKTRTHSYSRKRVLDFYLKIRRLYSRKEYNGTFFLDKQANVKLHEVRRSSAVRFRLIGQRSSRPADIQEARAQQYNYSNMITNEWLTRLLINFFY